MGSLPLSAAGARHRPRPEDHGPRSARSRVLWCCIVAALAACGDDAPIDKPTHDAGSDSGRDTGPNERDTGPHEEDSGSDEDSGAPPAPSSCGGSKYAPVHLTLNGERLPALSTPSAENSAATVVAVVTRLEEPSRVNNHLRFVHLKADDDVIVIESSRVATFGVEVGDRVELSWDIRYFGTGTPTQVRVELRVRGRLAFFYMFDGDVPEGFTSAFGAEQCRGETFCGTWKSRALRLTGPCGDTVEVVTDGSAKLCGYDVLPGTLHQEAVSSNSVCWQHVFFGIELTLTHPVVHDRDEDAGL